MEIKELKSYLEKCHDIASNLKLKLIFSIHQTSNNSNVNPYTLPPRKSKKLCYAEYVILDKKRS